MNLPSDKPPEPTEPSDRSDTKCMRTNGAGRTSLIVALIAASVSIGAALGSYWFTERVRTELAAQTVELQRQSLAMDTARLSLQSKVADLEHIKTNIMERDSGANHVRLTADVTKLLDDLRPNVQITCTFDRPDAVRIRVNCRFKSNSRFRISILPTSITVRDAVTNELISDWSSPFDGLVYNNVLSGGEGGNVYRATLSASARKLKNVQVLVDFEVRTEPLAISITQRLTDGYLTKEEVEQVAVQSYTQGVIGDFSR
jgi:hypothetical protein